MNWTQKIVHLDYPLACTRLSTSFHDQRMMLCMQLGPSNHFQTMAESTGFAERIHKYAQSAETQILPLGFNPIDRDVICGRARENFHHGKCDKEFWERSRCRSFCIPWVTSFLNWKPSIPSPHHTHTKRWKSLLSGAYQRKHRTISCRANKAWEERCNCQHCRQSPVEQSLWWLCQKRSGYWSLV